MSDEVRLLGRFYLNFKPRPAGNYTRGQMSAAAAYTMFCHAEFECYLEGWATTITDFAESKCRAGLITRPLAHLCTFHPGRNELLEVPKKDIWSEQFMGAIVQHRRIIKKNHGIKEKNICALLAPIGLDIRLIDEVLLGDLDAFGTIRGDYARQSHKMQTGMNFDPFDRQTKANSLVSLLAGLDKELVKYQASM
jgi:hypothetical protein